MGNVLNLSHIALSDIKKDSLRKYSPIIQRGVLNVKYNAYVSSSCFTRKGVYVAELFLPFFH